MPLAMLKEGDCATITGVTGRDALRAHLAELGFLPGTQVCVVANREGSMILQIKDSRVALGRDMAMRIMV